jgi:hypothetical protein
MKQLLQFLSICSAMDAPQVFRLTTGLKQLLRSMIRLRILLTWVAPGISFRFVLRKAVCYEEPDIRKPLLIWQGSPVFPHPYGAVLVEIMNDDGSMARLPELREVAKKFDFRIISIKDLIEFRIKRDSLIEEIVRVDMPTRYGTFQTGCFQRKKFDK